MDTGVLLCAAYARRELGLGLLYRRCASRLVVPLAVHRELQGQAQRSFDHAVKTAAASATGRRARFLTVDHTPFTPAERALIRQAVEEAERAKAGTRRAYRPKPGGHEGEIDGILLAKSAGSGAIFLSSDDAARSAGSRQGLSVGTFATLLAADIRAGDSLADDAAAECERLRAAGFDVGTTPTDAAALTALYVPPEL